MRGALTCWLGADLIQNIERDCVDKCPSVWESIAGLEQAKSLLEEAVVLPLVMPEYFQALCRKQVFNELDWASCGNAMLHVLLQRLCVDHGRASKFRGDSEKLVRMARFYAPTTIFFDEIDAQGW
ncbi:Katanin p60 ATPase-containing subunit A1 [Symbiodinium microadriaticum]|uniref:Katanin p60 ATPase-containing subunit A1 n=1 Tax=Symbiodinium microadriaticum TaxID=2951 RepID=A0A1Q9DW84_SYMMI|nr:Katanin p60 ATPase-containing subunit A1 [Symbiodinium microadriaticum]